MTKTHEPARILPFERREPRAEAAETRFRASGELLARPFSRESTIVQNVLRRMRDAGIAVPEE